MSCKFPRYYLRCDNSYEKSLFDSPYISEDQMECYWNGTKWVRCSNYCLLMHLGCVSMHYGFQAITYVYFLMMCVICIWNTHANSKAALPLCTSKLYLATCSFSVRFVQHKSRMSFMSVSYMRYIYSRVGCICVFKSMF